MHPEAGRQTGRQDVKDEVLTGTYMCMICCVRCRYQSVRLYFNGLPIWVVSR